MLVVQDSFDLVERTECNHMSQPTCAESPFSIVYNREFKPERPKQKHQHRRPEESQSQEQEARQCSSILLSGQWTTTERQEQLNS